MVQGISIKKAPYHSLILGIVLLRLGLEEFHASLAQSKRHFDAIVPENQVLRAWEEVGNDFRISEWFVCVFDFRVHRFAFLSANNLLRKYE